MLDQIGHLHSTVSEQTLARHIVLYTLMGELVAVLLRETNITCLNLNLKVLERHILL